MISFLRKEVKSQNKEEGLQRNNKPTEGEGVDETREEEVKKPTVAKRKANATRATRSNTRRGRKTEESEEAGKTSITTEVSVENGEEKPTFTADNGIEDCMQIESEAGEPEEMIPEEFPLFYPKTIQPDGK